MSNSSSDPASSAAVPSATNASLTVVLTVLFLVFFLAAGLVFFGRWDALDRKILVYVPKKKEKNNIGTKSLASLAAHRKAIDDAFLAGSVPDSVLDDDDDIEFGQRSRWIRRIRKILRCCCVSKPEELSILIGGNMLPRFVHALRGYHPWLWFFSEGSRKTTRVIRFVMTFKFLMTSIFVTTVLYDINNPSPQKCFDLSNQKAACLGTSSNILTGAPICMYDDSSDLCSVRPPPNNPAFLVLVAFLTVIVMLPFNEIFSLVLTYVCSKRPRLEEIGLDSFEWLGSAEPVVSKETASAGDELDRAQAVIRSVQGALYLYCERKAAGLCSQDETEGIELVVNKLGLVIRDNKIELTMYSKLWWADVNQCIRYRVEKSLGEARELLLNMQQYSEDSQKESYLAQHFLINRFSYIYRVALSRHFDHRARDVPQTIHPVLWILTWLFIIASLIFFIAWILRWGTAHDQSNTVSNWGINILLSNIQEVLIFSISRIFFINVLAIETIRPYLKNIHKYLVAKAEQGNKKRTLKETQRREDGQYFLLQYLDPLLWAANLSGSRFFTAVPDADLSKLSNGIAVNVVDDDGDEEEIKFSSVILHESTGEL